MFCGIDDSISVVRLGKDRLPGNVAAGQFWKTDSKPQFLSDTRKGLETTQARLEGELSVNAHLDLFHAILKRKLLFERFRELLRHIYSG